MTGAGLVTAALLVVTALAAVPAVVLFIELIAAALRPRGAPAGAAPGPNDDARLAVPMRLAVLMPAHDEAAGIAPAIVAVRAQLGPHDRLLVVADNCTDATAAVARAAGAEVIERDDAARRGKGYALDFGVRWLERDPPAMVVIVDADCIVAPQALARLRRRCVALGRPVQALYLMHAPAGAPLRLRVAEFAWLVKNQLRPLGAARLGAPCQLMGTGMAFPWSIVQAAPLATGHLVEDMQLGIDLAAAGTAPAFCADALVSSTFPLDAGGARAQRTRWEHGHLSVLMACGPRLLARALARRDAALLALTLDLMVPPLAALVLALAALVFVDAACWALGGGAAPLVVALAGLALVGTSVLVAWRGDGREIVSARELLGLPLYVAAKIPIYLMLVTKRQVEWVRTKRDRHGDERGH